MFSELKFGELMLPKLLILMKQTCLKNILFVTTGVFIQSI